MLFVNLNFINDKYLELLNIIVIVFFFFCRLKMSIIKTETTDELIERGFDFFAKHFPNSEKPDKLGVGPGRVNLIGEHTDYNDGFVLPMASNN